MSRVEWAALEGGEAETVLANLLYNKYGRAVRVRPAQGDYGIDVLIPATEAPEPWDVYQIKKFAANLTAGQKTQIEKSFSRLLVGIVRQGFKVNDWYLVMPLDPTPDNLTWFATVPEEAIKIARAAKKSPITDEEEATARAWLEAPGRKIEWKGLIFCEPLAAEFPYVIDHYLHGGAERLRNAMDSLTTLLTGDLKAKNAAAAAPGEGPTALVEPAALVDHLTTLDQVLDTDPHYIYGHSIEPRRPVIQPEPDLVAAAQVELPKGRWLTFKIYQRSSQSLDERPIPLEVMFKFEDESPEKQAFELWKKFGKPFEASAAVKVDLPGGLGTEVEEALVKVPAPGGVSKFINRMQIVDPDGTQLAELSFSATSTVGADSTGAWATSAEASGTIETEGFVDASSGVNQTIEFRFHPLTGRSVAAAAPAVQFARYLQAPNTLQIAGPVGPFHDLHVLTAAEPVVDPLVERLVQALVSIQTRTSTPLNIPDMSEFTGGEVNQILRAGRLIDGTTLVGKWHRASVEGFPEGTLEVGSHYQLAIYERLIVTLEGVDHVLGAVEHILLSAVIEDGGNGTRRAIPNLNDTVHSVFIEKMPEVTSEGVPAGAVPVRGKQFPDPEPDRSETTVP